MITAAYVLSFSLVSSVAIADLGTGFDREPVAADPQTLLDDCIYEPNLRKRAQSCTGAINSGKFDKIDLSVAYNNRGIAHGKLRQHDTALKDFEKAIDLDPEYADAHHNRAVEFARLGKFEKSIKDFDAAIALKPRADFYRSRGVVHENQGAFAKAVSDYSEAANMDPADYVSRNSLAWILATAPEEELRKGQHALKAAQEAVDLQDSPSHRDTLAAAYAETGKFSNAVEEQKLAIDMLRDLGAKDAIKAFEQRLSLYEQGRPYRQD